MSTLFQCWDGTLETKCAARPVFVADKEEIHWPAATKRSSCAVAINHEPSLGHRPFVWKLWGVLNKIEGPQTRKNNTQPLAFLGSNPEKCRSQTSGAFLTCLRSSFQFSIWWIGVPLSQCPTLKRKFQAHQSFSQPANREENPPQRRNHQIISVRSLHSLERSGHKCTTCYWGQRCPTYWNTGNQPYPAGPFVNWTSDPQKK